MPLNIPGLLVPFQLLFYPRLALPAIAVKDIRQLDWKALKDAGYKGAVFDKDNCLTIPLKDTLVPQLQDAWAECLQTFGANNVLIVSNSAGTRMDAGGIQSESVSHHLSVPVLPHASLKPSYACINSVRAYFASRDPPILDEELIVVGDRIFTDVVMANRMHRKYSDRISDEKLAMSREVGTRGPLAIWTTGVWRKESMTMRWCEHKLVANLRKWTGQEETLCDRFIREIVEKVGEEKKARWYWPPPSWNGWAK